MCESRSERKKFSREMSAAGGIGLAGRRGTSAQQRHTNTRGTNKTTDTKEESNKNKPSPVKHTLIDQLYN